MPVSERNMQSVVVPSGYIPTLDGWRAVAILWVMLYHSPGIMSFRWLDEFAKVGHFGVDIFFGLSGFLICSRLLDEWDRTGRISLLGFYRRRIFRILPPFWAYLFAVGILWAAGYIREAPLPFVSAFVFLRNYVPPSMDQHEHYVGHSWSLSVEEHFYLIWPLLLLYLTPRRAGWTALVLGLVIATWRFVVLRSDPGALIWRTDLRLDGLLFGAALAILVHHQSARDVVRRCLILPVWVGLLAVFLGLTMGWISLPVPRLWISILVPLLIVGTALRPESLPGRDLEWGPLRWIGRLSYSLYLWQQLFLLRPEDPAAFGLLQTFPLNWLATVVCAQASYLFVERPFVKFGHRVSAKLQGQTVVFVGPPRERRQNIRALRREPAADSPEPASH